MPRGGAYRDRVTFQRQAVTDDGAGNTGGAWADHWANVAANFMETGGREAIRSGAVSDSVTATMRLRRSTQALAITAADRVVARGQNWNIKRIIALGNRNRELEMTLESGVTT